MKSPGRSAWALLYKGRQLGLPTGEVVVGRGSGCDLILDDPLVSRTHARFSVTSGGVTLEDLGSANGVYVNERLIDRPTVLQDGDRVLLGTQQLSFFGGVTEGDAYPKPPSSDLLNTGKVVPPAASQAPQGDLDAPESAEELDEESTVRKNRPELLSQLVNDLVGRGRLDQATRVLDDWVKDLRRAGEQGRAPEARVAETAHLCMDLTEISGRGHWPDQVIDLYTAVGRLPAPAVLARLEEVTRTVVGVDAERLTRYSDHVRGLVVGRGEEIAELAARIDRLTTRS